MNYATGGIKGPYHVEDVGRVSHPSPPRDDTALMRVNHGLIDVCRRIRDIRDRLESKLAELAGALPEDPSNQIDKQPEGMLGLLMNGLADAERCLEQVERAVGRLENI